jgi:hypothetical protein
MFGVKMMAQFHFRLDLSCRRWQHARLDSQAGIRKAPETGS